MTYKINKGKGKGSVVAPPSKSMAHRLLICAALSEESRVSNLAFSQDILATLDCLKALGAQVKINGNEVILGGLSLQKAINSNRLFCRESGSTLRFMIPLCLMRDEEITLCGSERLFSRSLSVYEKIALEQGLLFKTNSDSVTVKGLLKSGEYRVRGDISSQFISGLMFALPLTFGDSKIIIDGPIESGSYIGLTLKALKSFGIDIDFADNVISIGGGQKFKSGDFRVEGDYSNGAFFDALGCLGSDITVDGLCADSYQGDRVYKELFKALCEGTPLIDISDCPDLGPILIAVAAAKNGAEFIGTRRLKIKESDRALAMKSELQKLGVDITVEDNRIIVPKALLKAPEKPICGHNDHRIVMSMAVLLTLTGGIIEGAEAVSKSFPDFFEQLNLLGSLAEVI